MHKSIVKFLAPVVMVLVLTVAACSSNPVLPEQNVTQVVKPTFTEEGGPDCTHPVGSTICADIGANGWWEGCPTHTVGDHTISTIGPEPWVSNVHNMSWAAYNCKGGWHMTT